jgi:hypothetical protein
VDWVPAEQGSVILGDQLGDMVGGLYWSGHKSDFLAGELFELAGQVRLPTPSVDS